MYEVYIRERLSLKKFKTPIFRFRSSAQNSMTMTMISDSGPRDEAKTKIW